MVAYLFLIVAIAMRFLPHPLSFTPLTAAMLYFGAKHSRRMLWVPMAMLVAADVVLTKVMYAYPFSADHFVTFAWYAGVLLLGGALRERTTPLRVMGAALGSSLSFFVLSNFAVWAAWTMYPKNLSGLAACYVAAIPFYRNQFAGDMLFTAVAFGVPALVASFSRERSGNMRAA